MWCASIFVCELDLDWYAIKLCSNSYLQDKRCVFGAIIACGAYREKYLKSWSIVTTCHGLHNCDYQQCSPNSLRCTQGEDAQRAGLPMTRCHWPHNCCCQQSRLWHKLSLSSYYKSTESGETLCPWLLQCMQCMQGEGAQKDVCQ